MTVGENAQTLEQEMMAAIPGESGSKTEQPDGNESKQIVEPPKDWSDDDKAAFNALSDLGEKGAKAQDFLLRTQKNLQAGFTKSTTENANQRKTLEKELSKWNSPFAPFEEQLKGVDKQQFVGSLLNAKHILDTDPKTGLLMLAEQYGIELESLSENNNDPELTKLKRENAVLKSKSTMSNLDKKRMEFSNLEEQRAEINAQIDAFKKEEKDGKLTHPHFDDVSAMMGAVFNAEPNVSMQDAYDRAILIHPTHGQDRIKEMAEKKAKELDKENQEKLDKSTSAAKTVKGSNVTDAKKVESLEEEMLRRAKG